MAKLTAKQEKFVNEYLIDLNASRAAAAAGYSKKTAPYIGAENLKKPQIKNRIDEQLTKIESAKIANVTEVMQYLTAVMRAEKKEETVVVEGTGDGCSEARVVEKKVSPREQVKAAELLGKRFGMFTDNVNLSGEGVVQIVDNINKSD